jgi:hypothetical protein
MHTIDVLELRRSLDAMTVALTKPSTGITRWVPTSDRSRIADSLRELLHKFRSEELATKRALGVTPRTATHTRSEELKASLSALSTSLRKCLGGTYSEEELRHLNLLLRFPAPDFLGALGRSSDENSHSDVIAYLLDPRQSPGIAPLALERLASLLPSPQHWSHLFAEAVARDELSVRREVQIGRFWEEDANSLDRIDIVISGRGFVLAIENKVWAREHDRQTETYWEWLEGIPGAKAGLFLSPGGGRASCEHFTPISYQRMAWCFLGESPSRTPEEEVMLSAYFRAVFGHVLRHRAGMILGSEP